MILSRAEILTYLGKAASATDAEVALIDMLHPMAEAAVKAYLDNDLEYQQHVEYYPLGEDRTWDRETTLADYGIVGNRAVVNTGPAGTNILALKHTPVWQSGLEVREDVGAYAGTTQDAFADETELTLGVDYYLDVDDVPNVLSRTGLLYRIGAWPTEPRSIKVTYYGGETAQRLATIASDVKYATLLTAAKMFLSAKPLWHEAGPKVSESIGKYSYSTSAQILGSMFGAGYSATLPPEAQHLLFKHKNLGRWM